MLSLCVFAAAKFTITGATVGLSNRVAALPDKPAVAPNADSPPLCDKRASHARLDDLVAACTTCWSG